MSDDLDFDDQNDDETGDQHTDRNPLRAQLRRLERENKALKEKAATGEQAIRDLEFVKAGVPIDDPKAKYFLKGYDGELTAEAIKAAAVEVGLVEADGETDDIPAAERQAHQRMTDATAGAGPASDTDTWAAAIADARAKRDFQRVVEIEQQRAAAQRAQQK